MKIGRIFFETVLAICLVALGLFFGYLSQINAELLTIKQELRVAQQRLQARIDSSAAEMQSLLYLTRFTISATDEVYFAGVRIPLERPIVRERVQEAIFKLMGWHSNLIIRWQRMGRFRWLIERELAKRHMPLDLFYLFVWESGLDVLARSSMGAQGLAQFIESTARRRFHMTINSMMDERVDPAVAIPAACEYLKECESYVQDYLLGMAGYNAGPEATSSRVSSQTVRDYFDLWQPRETEYYVPLIVATKLAYERFLPNTIKHYPQYQPYPLTKRVTIYLRRSLTIRELADTLGLSVDQFRLVNAHLQRRDKFPPGLYHKVFNHVPDTSFIVGLATQ
jgi:hypothetical protein